MKFLRSTYLIFILLLSNTLLAGNNDSEGNEFGLEGYWKSSNGNQFIIKSFDEDLLYRDMNSQDWILLTPHEEGLYRTPIIHGHAQVFEVDGTSITVYVYSKQTGETSQLQDQQFQKAAYFAQEKGKFKMYELQKELGIGSSKAKKMMQDLGEKGIISVSGYNGQAIITDRKVLETMFASASLGMEWNLQYQNTWTKIPEPEYVESYEYKHFVMYHPSFRGPIGFTWGAFSSKTSMYFTIRSSLYWLPGGGDDLEDNLDPIDYESDPYYRVEKRDETMHTKFSMTFGGVSNIHDELIYLYWGGGLGWSNRYNAADIYYSTSSYDWTTGTFGENQYVYEETRWVRDDDESAFGLELEAGLMLNFNRLCVGAGFTSTNVQVFDFTLGIGLSY